jgi:hypothetical protein
MLESFCSILRLATPYHPQCFRMRLWSPFPMSIIVFVSQFVVVIQYQVSEQGSELAAMFVVSFGCEFRTFVLCWKFSTTGAHCETVEISGLPFSSSLPLFADGCLLLGHLSNGFAVIHPKTFEILEVVAIDGLKVQDYFESRDRYRDKVSLAAHLPLSPDGVCNPVSSLQATIVEH